MNDGKRRALNLMDVKIVGNENKFLKQCDRQEIEIKMRKYLWNKNGNRMAPGYVPTSNSTCKVLHPKGHLKFDLNVYGYSFLYDDWDHTFKFAKMKSNRMLHRFATLSDGHREYLMAVFGRTKWYDFKNTVDIFIHDYYNYWITEKIRGLPTQQKSYKVEDNDPWKLRSIEILNGTELGNYDFATVVIPAEWMPSCNYKLEWNNHEMLSRGTHLKETWKIMTLSILSYLALVE